MRDHAGEREAGTPCSRSSAAARARPGRGATPGRALAFAARGRAPAAACPGGPHRQDRGAGVTVEASPGRSPIAPRPRRRRAGARRRHAAGWSGAVKAGTALHHGYPGGPHPGQGRRGAAVTTPPQSPPRPPAAAGRRATHGPSPPRRGHRSAQLQCRPPLELSALAFRKLPGDRHLQRGAPPPRADDLLDQPAWKPRAPSPTAPPSGVPGRCPGSHPAASTDPRRAPRVLPPVPPPSPRRCPCHGQPSKGVYRPPAATGSGGGAARTGVTRDGNVAFR